MTASVLESCLASRKFSALDEGQVRRFLDKGYVIVRDCFSREAAQKWIDKAYERLGYDPRDPKTWKEERGFLPGEGNVMVSEFAPKAWAAICDLVGGKERIRQGEAHTWSDSFVIKFPVQGAKPGRSPSSQFQGNWHLDGDEKTRFLDSPELGLLTFVLWSDADAKGGGTFFACDSNAHVSRYFLEHPEGAPKSRVPVGNILRQCKDLAEFTGKAGDVALALPSMVHSESDNHSVAPRFLTARIVELNAPLDFNRPKAEEFSLVELAVLRSLGRQRLEFKRAPEKKAAKASVQSPSKGKRRS